MRPIQELEFHKENLRRGIRQNIERKTDRPSDLTLSQESLVHELGLWICGQKKSTKGILLLGSKGTGKTTIMQVVVAYYTFLFQKVIISTHAKALVSLVNKNGIDYFYKRPIFIDDLGKEPQTTVIWGQKYDTWPDLFAIRYENQSLTFATGNYKLEGEYLNMYGEVIMDRMKEHFNIFEITGDSLRQ